MNKWRADHVHIGMEHNKSWIKLTVAGLASALLLSNCVTTYDAAGRPVQRVDSRAVATGALVLAQVAAFAIVNHNYSHRGHHGHHGHRSHRRHH